MQFNNHFQLRDKHAFLSPSSYSWINYDDDHLDRRFTTAMAAQRGTELHSLARELIRLGVRLPKARTTLNMYVNDAIGYRMTPEQSLFYSVNCFGQADAVSFSRNTLRIFDLKTGVNVASVSQLEIYAALFCLEYKYKPFDITIDLRIYQNDQVVEYECDAGGIARIMSQIIHFDKRLNALREEASV